MCQCYSRYRIRKRKGYHVILANEHCVSVILTALVFIIIIVTFVFVPAVCLSSFILSNSFCASSIFCIASSFNLVAAVWILNTSDDVSYTASRIILSMINLRCVYVSSKPPAWSAALRNNYHK
eukprot:731857_1